MRNLDLMAEIAALAGYGIAGSTQQIVDNKTKAQRRVNLIRSDIASRYSGRWASAYKEGWLPLVPVYGTGTVQVTIDSRTVLGTTTVWTAAMAGRKFLGPDNCYYKIASVTDVTTLLLTEPYQGASVASGGSYQIWKDEYVLYPDVFSLIDFVNYIEPSQGREYSNKEARSIFPRATANLTPNYWTLIGRKRIAGEYSTGTISITVNTRTLTGVGTSWMGNVYPGYDVVIGSYKYHVSSVDSDTQITLIEAAVVAATAGTTYVATGRNALIVRFLAPSSQTVVSYGYFEKVYSFVNDNDEDWMAELYPHVVINGAVKFDYLDKNDAVRAQIATQLFENDIHNAHTADSGQFGGTSTVGLDIPGHARE